MKLLSFKLQSTNKKNLFLIPFLFTFANALFGFLSVIKTLEEDYRAAALCIILATIMDLCDGRLARMIGSTSVLGMELDSSCDAISFCFAPSILIYSWKLYQLSMPGIIVLGMYLCTGLFRLARFNSRPVENTKSFMGLPTTVSAFLLANIVLYQDWIKNSLFGSLLKPDRMAFFVTIVALLMISTIKFPSAKRLEFVGKTKNILYIILLISLYLLIKGYPLPLLFCAVYILFSFIIYLLKEFVQCLH